MTSGTATVLIAIPNDSVAGACWEGALLLSV